MEEGTAQCLTCEGVLVEVVCVLASRGLYNLPREEVRRKLLTIIDLRGLLLPLKETYRRALDMYVSIPQLDFVDALSVAHNEHARIETIVSFDRDFDRVPGLHRREP